MKEGLVDRLRPFMENETRSCSMDVGGITPEYVQRMWREVCLSKRLRL